jgi:hypothetical protein
MPKNPRMSGFTLDQVFWKWQQDNRQSVNNIAGVQEVRWKKDGIEPAMIKHFNAETGS